MSGSTSNGNITSSGSIKYSKMNTSTTINRNSSQKHSFGWSVDLPDQLDLIAASKTTHLQQSSSPILMVLRRNCSVSSSSATTSITGSGGFQSAVKRAFSMRRSSSVSAERYSRINIYEEDDYDDDDDHHHHHHHHNRIHDHGDADTTCPNKASRSSSVSNKEICSRGSGKGKILKACKRLLFGL